MFVLFFMKVWYGKVYMINFIFLYICFGYLCMLVVNWNLIKVVFMGSKIFLLLIKGFFLDVRLCENFIYCWGINYIIIKIKLLFKVFFFLLLVCEY